MTAKLSAIVLAAGFGTRLLPLTYCRAKPAFPVSGTPLIRRTLSWLAAAGVRDAVLNLHYKPATITSVVGDGSDLGIRVRYSWEPKILGSAGGPRRAMTLTSGTQFIIVNGDTFTDLNLNEMIDVHQRSNAKITLAVARNNQPQRYGGVLTDVTGRVQGFTSPGNTTPSYHFTGVQIVEAEVFETLKDGQTASTIGGIYSLLAKQKDGAIRIHEVTTKFYDIGTPTDYLNTALLFTREAGLSTPLLGERTSVDPTSTLIRTVLWDDVAVEKNCKLTDCIVGDGVRIPPGSRFFRQVIVIPPDHYRIPNSQLVGKLCVASLSADLDNNNSIF